MRSRGGSGALVTAISLLLAAPLAFASETNQTEMAREFYGMGEPRHAVWGFEPANGGTQSFKVKLGGFAARKSPDGYILAVPGQAAARNPGAPDLPVVSVLLRGMLGALPRIEMGTVKWAEITNISVAPIESCALEDVTTNAPSYRQVRTPAATVYGEDCFWPDCIARLDDAWLGTNRIVRIEVTPFQYNPVRGVLRYCQTLEGRIVVEPAKGPATQ